MKSGGLKTKKEYEAALEEVDRMFNSKGNSKELEMILSQIKEYEDQHFIIPEPDSSKTP